MTKVKMQMHPVVLPDTKEDTHMLCLTVEGHAGYAPKGQDIVCAAVSMLVQALAGGLARLDENRLFDFAVDGTPDSGCAGITAVPTNQGWERVYGMFQMALTGFYLLGKAYPDYVSAEDLFAEEEKLYEE